MKRTRCVKAMLRSAAAMLAVLLFVLAFAGCRKAQELDGLYVEKSNTSYFEFKQGNKCTMTMLETQYPGTYKITGKTLELVIDYGTKKDVLTADIINDTEFRFTSGSEMELVYIRQ